MRELTVSLPADSVGDSLRELLADEPGLTLLEWNLTGAAPRQDIDIVVPPYWGGAARLSMLDQVHVGLVQWLSIGYDAVGSVLPKHCTLANAASVHETSTAELAVGLAIAMQRGIDGFARDQRNAKWNPHGMPSLADRRVLLVGYGGVGKAVEARLSGFEVQIQRIARTPRHEQNLAGADVAVLGMHELHTGLAWAEVVIVAVPLSQETTHLFNADALAAMPEGALLINVARGPVVDTDALVAELQQGRLRAALDVTEPEPLPAEHPLWQCPNVLITPHVGGDTTAMAPRVAALLRRQFALMRAGQRPENLVFAGEQWQ